MCRYAHRRLSLAPMVCLPQTSPGESRLVVEVTAAVVRGRSVLSMPLTRQIRRERALDGMMERPSDREQAGSGHGDGGAEGVEETPAAEEEEDEEEAKCKRAIEVEKRVYRDSFQVY